MNLALIFSYCIIQLVNLYLGDMYMKDALKANPGLEGNTADTYNNKVATVVLLVITVVSLIVGVLSCYGCRTTYKNYKSSVKNYNNFLVNYSETPRSKIIKKYRSPLEPLAEASMRQEGALSIYSQALLDHIEDKDDLYNISEDVIEGDT
jgi:hypothetical protein